MFLNASPAQIQFTPEVARQASIPPFLLLGWCIVDMQVHHVCYAGGKGFSFATWLRLEDATFQPGTSGRSLFNLIHRSPEEVRGVSAAMKGT